MQETLTLSVDQLSDLWLIKYGSTWVNFEEQEEFYQYAAIRLSATDKLEKHYVNNKVVYKLFE
jgi:hypothetical protein